MRPPDGGPEPSRGKGLAGSGGGRGRDRGESVETNEVRTPRVSAPGAGGVKGRGGVAPDPRRRETADKAGKTRAYALSFQHTRGEGVRKRAWRGEGR